MDVKCKPRAKYADRRDEYGSETRATYQAEFFSNDPVGWINNQRLKNEVAMQKKLVQHFNYHNATEAIHFTNLMVEALISQKQSNEQI